MAAPPAKRRRFEGDVRVPKKKIRIKKQAAYHSSSEDEEQDVRQTVAKTSSRRQQSSAPPKSILRRSESDAQVDGVSKVQKLDQDNNANELERNTALNAIPASDDSVEEEDGEDVTDGTSGDGDGEIESITDFSSIASSDASKAKKKRNDPDAFATSISKILDTKLTTSKRQDPVLSRSKSAADANKSIADSKLDQKARAQVRAEKKQALEKGRIRDVLGLETPDVDTGMIQEEEKRLKKTAQRGVVRLFNAVRAAQVKAEEARKQSQSEGIVGMQKREEKVNEMSKQGFLDLISSGGKATTVS